MSCLTASQAPEVPKSLAFSKKDLKPAFDLISTKRMRSFLTEFSGFRTRYYRSEDGKKSQRWLLSQIQDAIKGRKDMSVREFQHPWGQSSIILRLERDQANVKKHHEDSIVILSAHQDSTNMLPFLPAPGADDDGSGTTTIMEVLHALVETDFKPSNSSIEWHWNSAEEGGLLGSQAIAQAYHQAGTKVKAMLQMDMVRSRVLHQRMPPLYSGTDGLHQAWHEGAHRSHLRLCRRRPHRLPLQAGRRVPRYPRRHYQVWLRLLGSRIVGQDWRSLGLLDRSNLRRFQHGSHSYDRRQD
jgi:hypothetical protein